MNPSWRTALAGLGAALLVVLAAPAPADDAPASAAKKVPIYLDLSAADSPPGVVRQPGEKLIVAPGTPVRISGAAALELAGKPLLVTVTPPKAEWDFDPGSDEVRCLGDEPPGTKVVGTYLNDPPKTIEAKVGSGGSFSAEFTPKKEGEHEVVVTDQGGGYRGEAKFISGAPEIEERCEEIPQDEVEEDVAGLTDVACEATEALASRIKELPPSPARDEVEKKLEEAQQALKEGMPCGEAPAWVNGTYHVNKLRKLAPQMRKATEPVVIKIKGWVEQARKARGDAPKALAQLTQGNVVCDQLDVIVNGLKFVDFYLGLIIEPAKFLGDWAKENVPTKLVGMIPAVSRTAAVKEGVELGWRGVTSYQPKREAGKIKIGAAGFDRALSHGKVLMSGLSNFVANRVFEAFCQTFQGPVTGSMSAEFISEHGIWWKYDIEIGGQLILRYPQGAKGERIALTGEFLGNATHIKSWDNAVPVLYPELAQGTVFRTMRIEPIAMDTIPYVYEKNLGQKTGDSIPDFNPIKSTIDQGGAIAQLVTTPAFFRVPVRAELNNKKLRLELQPAAVDFDDLRVKVVQIMLPVLSMWPEVIDYALPYKGAHFIMLRAMSDGPVEFDVVYDRDAMTITKDFNRKRETAETRGVYSLKVKACNPGC